MKKIKIIELFGGIGAIRKAFINLRIPHKVIDYVEIDANAVKSYNALYKECYDPQSVVDYHAPNKQVDLLMHGSPCQDFSLIGQQKGGLKGSGTRSSLLYETVRIIDEMKHKPYCVLWENVTGVLNNKMKPSFDHYLEEMERIGYTNSFEVLNAMEFGIPQTRKRVFVISLLDNRKFNFDNLIKTPAKHINHFLERRDLDLYKVTQPSMLKVINSPLNELESRNFKQSLFIIDDHCKTITTKQMRIPNSGVVPLKEGGFRYLTELECLRLMGFSTLDYIKLRETHPSRKGCTSTILYRQAGNSIVVPILESIVMELLKILRDERG